MRGMNAEETDRCLMMHIEAIEKWQVMWRAEQARLEAVAKVATRNLEQIEAQIVSLKTKMSNGLAEALVYRERMSS